MLKITYPMVKVFCFTIGIFIALYIIFELAAPVIHYLPLAICSLVAVVILSKEIMEEFENAK